MKKEELKSEIISNRIRTPDGTLLESKSIHDYVSYKDMNGNTYAVDGGKEYLSRSFDVHDYEECSVTLADKFELIRETMLWGTYGKDGKQKLTHKKLSELSDEHIKAILETQKHISEKYKICFINELQYRVANKIKIKD